MFKFNSGHSDFWCPDLGADVRVFSFEGSRATIDGFNADNYGDYDMVSLNQGLFMKSPVTHDWIKIDDYSLEGGVNVPISFRVNPEILTRDLADTVHPNYIIGNRFDYFPQERPHISISDDLTDCTGFTWTTSWMDQLYDMVKPSESASEPEVEMTEEEWNTLMEGA